MSFASFCVVCAPPSMRHMLHKCSRGSNSSGIKWKINFANTHKTDMQTDRLRRTARGREKQRQQREQRTNLPHATCHTHHAAAGSTKKCSTALWFLLHVVTLARLMTVFGVNILCFGRNVAKRYSRMKKLFQCGNMSQWTLPPKTFPTAFICTLSHNEPNFLWFQAFIL